MRQPVPATAQMNLKDGCLVKGATYLGLQRRQIQDRKKVAKRPPGGWEWVSVQK
jgi:hypothetical protein